MLLQCFTSNRSKRFTCESSEWFRLISELIQTVMLTSLTDSLQRSDSFVNLVLLVLILNRQKIQTHLHCWNYCHVKCFSSQFGLRTGRPALIYLVQRRHSSKNLIALFFMCVSDSLKRISSDSSFVWELDYTCVYCMFWFIKRNSYKSTSFRNQTTPNNRAVFYSFFQNNHFWL